LPQLVREIGSLAGFAAFAGLAVLSAMYFSQAREIKRLREWAGRAPERSQAGTAALPGRATRAGASGLRAVPERSVSVRPPRWYGQIGARYLGLALAGLLVLGSAAVYGVSQLSGDADAGKSGSAQASHGSGLAKKPRRSRGAVKPGNVTVAVLNGTTVSGLAAGLRDEIAAAGFKRGMIDVYSDQQLATSVVQYAPGHEADAKAVSGRLGISRREPVSANSRARAGDATVIVIAGADKAP
jgi:LytR cell envelope-related transcriptional attenuator